MRDDFFRIEGATVTNLPASATGFSGERLRDDSTNYQWQTDAAGTKHYTVDLGDGTGGTPGVLKPEYIAILNHNLASTGSTWDLQYSDDGVIWTSGTGAVTPADDRYVIKDIRSIAGGVRRHWRIEIEAGTAKTAICEILLGRFVDLDDVLQPAFIPRQANMRLKVSRSDTGIILRVTGDGVRNSFRFSLDLLKTTLVNSTTDPTGFRFWWENIGSQGEPSLFHWQVLDYTVTNPYESNGIFTRLPRRPMAPFNNRTPDLQNLSFDVEGRSSFKPAP